MKNFIQSGKASAQNFAKITNTILDNIHKYDQAYAILKKSMGVRYTNTKAFAEYNGVNLKIDNNVAVQGKTFTGNINYGGGSVYKSNLSNGKTNFQGFVEKAIKKNKSLYPDIVDGFPGIDFIESSIVFPDGSKATEITAVNKEGHILETMTSELQK